MEQSVKVMENTPVLATGRLILRKFTPDDLDDLFAILCDKEVNTFLPWFPARTKEEARAHLETVFLQAYRQPAAYRYAVCLKAGDRPVGYVCVGDAPAYDLGYALKKECWHQGIATEAAGAVMARLAQNGYPYVTATHDVRNPRSGQVMRKLGMTYCYSYKEQWQPKDIPVVFRMYQKNLDGQRDRIYRGYWDSYPHFIEPGL